MANECMKPIVGDPMSDRAVYLGDGVWWQMTCRQLQEGVGRGMPQQFRQLTGRGV